MRTLLRLTHPARARRLAPWLGALVFFALVPAGFTQEVHWRNDYNAARKESQEKGLPLVIDFGTENCVWCVRQDQTTFREPTIVGLLNQKFIALKVDGNREAALAQMLRIQVYPTLVLASPEGKILATLEGYQDASRLHDHMKRVLASVTNPEWMLREYQAAQKAVEASDFARAVTLLARITEDGKTRPVQKQAAALLRELEQKAATQLAKAKQLNDQGKVGEAVESLTDLVRSFAGTQAAAEGGRMIGSMAGAPEIKLKQRGRRAQELLAQANDDYQARHYLSCLERCETLTSSYGDLPEGVEAIRLSAKIKSQPEFMQGVCDDLGAKLGLMYLALAESHAQKGQNRQAAECLERVLRTFPGTPNAEMAQQRLTQLRGTVQGVPTSFKKQ
jgi:thioredoxin-related protein/outer membrane protein assembly factor BamD (BamD/ComL family)